MSFLLYFSFYRILFLVNWAEMGLIHSAALH